MRPFQIPAAGAAGSQSATIREALEQHFGDDANYGIALLEGVNCFPDRTEVDNCTSYAVQVYCELSLRLRGQLRCRIVGFGKDDNPQSGMIKKGAEGHDFALVEGRYIVDGWLKNVNRGAPRAVFDLQDPADADDVSRIYGDTNTFMPLWVIENAEESQYMLAQRRAGLPVPTRARP
jgi:hypothetical protein